MWCIQAVDWHWFGPISQSSCPTILLISNKHRTPVIGADHLQDDKFHKNSKANKIPQFNKRLFHLKIFTTSSVRTNGKWTCISLRSEQN